MPSGYTFYSDSIRLKKNVDFHIQKGATIKATSNIDGYIRPNKLINDPKTALIGNPVTGKPSFVFIYAYEADGCSISGEGTIDANGHAFVARKDQYYVTGDFYPRPTVMYVEKVTIFHLGISLLLTHLSGLFIRQAVMMYLLIKSEF